MGEWDYKILDHKWNNLKRWVECCETKFGKDGLIAVGRMGDMMRKIQEMTDITDEAVIKFMRGKNEDSLSS
jgi:hypothetical protein